MTIFRLRVIMIVIKRLTKKEQRGREKWENNLVTIVILKITLFSPLYYNFATNSTTSQSSVYNVKWHRHYLPLQWNSVHYEISPPYITLSDDDECRGISSGRGCKTTEWDGAYVTSPLPGSRWYLTKSSPLTCNRGVVKFPEQSVSTAVLY